MPATPRLPKPACSITADVTQVRGTAAWKEGQNGVAVNYYLHDQYTIILLAALEHRQSAPKVVIRGSDH